MTEYPLVSIGFPIYNGGEDLRGAFDALLAQSYPNFELIVSDNASTDGTWEICQHYATGDARIHLYRNSENRGASYNFGRVFEVASGKYFMWAAHDDRWHRDYVKTTVDALEAQPDAALCYSDQLFIDTLSGTEQIKHYEMNLRDPQCWRRAYRLLTTRPTPYAIIYGVFRRKALQVAFPFPTLAAADLVILLKVIMQGTFVHVPPVLYHRKTRVKSFEARMRTLVPKGHFVSPAAIFLDLFFAMCRIVWESRESFVGKLVIIGGAIQFVFPRLVLEAVIRPIGNLRHVFK